MNYVVHITAHGIFSVVFDSIEEARDWLRNLSDADVLDFVDNSGGFEPYKYEVKER